MALQAESRDGFDQQMFRFYGRMGAVTRRAVFIYRIVSELRFRNSLTHLLVTAKTEVLAGFDEIEFIVGCMRIMTFRAISACHILVDAQGILGDHGPVAFGAHFVGGSSQQFPMRRGVGIMASHAVTFFQRRMNKGGLHLLLELNVAGQAGLPARAEFQPVLVLSVSPYGHEGNKYRYQGEKDYLMPSVHPLSLFIASAPHDNLRTTSPQRADVGSP
jgi:hypothetical protein